MSFFDLGALPSRALLVVGSLTFAACALDASDHDAPPPTAPASPPAAGCSKCADGYMGSVRGDLGSDKIFRRGTGPTRVYAEINEGDDGVFDAKLGFKARLESPPGRDFDLTVYMDCTGAEYGESRKVDQPEEVRGGWGDGSGDQGRCLILEVTEREGSSGTGAWELSLEGNP